jgi:fatty-acyl-CoA synthase
MAEKIYRPGENYDYPLIIKKLLKDPLIKSPDREIVYGDRHRYTYRDLNQRLGKLANGLTELGATAGDTIAVFDYDSHRYLECFFAVPMIGAVLQTVNWRLSADQLEIIRRPDRIHHQPRRSQDDHYQCRFPAYTGGYMGQTRNG